MSDRCQNVKKMSSCQKDVKKSNVCTMGEVHKKNDTMRFTHIDLNFDVTYEGHQNWSKILSMHIWRVISDHHI